MELSRQLKKEHKKVVKQVIGPAMGVLATSYLIVHRGEISAYVQKHAEGGFKAGLAKGVKAEVKEFGGRIKRFGRLEIQSTNMESEDLELLRQTLAADEAQ